MDRYIESLDIVTQYLIYRIVWISDTSVSKFLIFHCTFKWVS